MQTAEYRHMTKNEKQAISRPTRRHFKRVMAFLFNEIGKCGKNEASRDEKLLLLEERKEVIRQFKACYS